MGEVRPSALVRWPHHPRDRQAGAAGWSPVSEAAAAAQGALLAASLQRRLPKPQVGQHLCP
eukprot:5117605-Lingulodinium_polyedra.AAC.1